MSTPQLPLPPELSPRGRARRGTRHGGAAVASPRTTGFLRYARAMSWVAVAASALVLLGSGSLWAYVSYLNGKINHLGAICVRDCSHRPTEKGGTENFLLVGSDTRAGDNSTGALAGVADGSGGNGRSDSTMLVHLSASSGRVTVLSFPRDLEVQMPSYVDSSGTHPASAQKFNAAYSYGGMQLLVKQVEQLSGLRVDHYVSIDFAGFTKIVDALGGINVCISSVPGSTTNLHDPGGDGSGGSGFIGHVGINHLNGERALEFVRQRHGLPQGDLDRIQRQHRFLAAVFAKVQSAGTLLNPLKLNHVLSAAASDLSVDKGTNTDDLATLAKSLKDLSGSKVEYFTVPNHGGYDSLGSVQIIDRDPAKALFQAIYDDQDPAHPVAPKPSKKPSATPSSAAPKLTIPASSITVDVLNGSGQRGQAGKVGTDLQGVGFKIGTIGTATSSGTTTTEVHYGSNRADSAKTVAAAIPGATLVPDSSIGEDVIQVITGSSYSGVKPVTVSGTGGSAGGGTTPTASASPSAPPSIAPDANGGKQAGSKSTGTEGISIAGGCGP
ncbi:MAG TPA: LCP family protein [Mycobacteriales bacterium]|nr:LCP family protein [Mycobacteriales bacterium]